MRFKKLKLCAAFMALIVQEQALAWNLYQIWTSDEAMAGNLQYSGLAGGVASTQVTSVILGRSILRYCWTSYPIVSSVRWQTRNVASLLPRTINIGGKIVPLNVYGQGKIIPYNNFFYLIREDNKPEDVGNIKGGGCDPIGFTYYVNRQSQPLRIELKLPSDLAAGKYTGYFQTAHALISSYSNVQEGEGGDHTSDNTVYNQMKGGGRVPYDIEILGTCSASPASVTIDHSTLNPATGPENEKTSAVTVLCSDNARLKLSLLANKPSSETYAGGTGVDLGNGWNSLLKVINPADGSQGSAIDISAPANTGVSVTLSSTLKKTASSAAGSLNGSAVLLMYFN
ncbi:MrpH family fimbial adhesin [Enterobacter cloacae]|uniref:MrpH family fimbial adhesin n=1 Tax=Enterobacter cloacae TaxID=550 RepID=UPI003DA03774